MHVSGWNNGAWHKSGAGYGIKIDKDDRDHFFRQAWSAVQIELPSGVITTVGVSKSFWRKCSELRSQDIGRWMIEARLAPWQLGAPPVLKLEPAGGLVFRLAK